MWTRKKRMKVGYIILGSRLTIQELNEEPFAIIKEIGALSGNEYIKISNDTYESCGVIGRLYSMSQTNPLCIGDDYYCENAVKVKRKYVRKITTDRPDCIYRMTIYKKL